MNKGTDRRRVKGRWRHRHAPALSRLASQALLHPTVVPFESRGPTSCEGHPGFRSAGHEATEQFAEGMIDIGMLNPSSRETNKHRTHWHVRAQPLRQPPRPFRKKSAPCARAPYHRNSRGLRCPRASTLPPSREGEPAACMHRIASGGVEGGGGGTRVGPGGGCTSKYPLGGRS
jgi:hypothetical protein